MVENFIGVLATIVFALTIIFLVAWIGCIIFRVDLSITKKLEDVTCGSFLFTILLIIIFNIVINL